MFFHNILLRTIPLSTDETVIFKVVKNTRQITLSFLRYVKLQLLLTHPNINMIYQKRLDE